MVQISEIRSQNHAFAESSPTNKVAVFIGATSGIGKGTLHALARLLIKPQLYVVGRSEESFSAQREHLSTLNPEATITFIQAEISLLSEVDRASKLILSSTPRIDCLCMSAGYLPLAGPIQTSEHLELCLTLSYFSRLRFLYLLLPALLESPNPRVLSILGGGAEGPLVESDLGLERSWTLTNLVNHAGTLTTLAFEGFAEREEGLTLVHSAPGLVKTGIAGRVQVGEGAGSGWIGRLMTGALRWAAGWMIALKGVGVEEAGERQVNLLVSERFGKGVWRVDQFGDVAGSSQLLEKYKAEGWVEKGWDFTVGVWRKVLGNAA